MARLRRRRPPGRGDRDAVTHGPAAAKPDRKPLSRCPTACKVALPVAGAAGTTPLPGATGKRLRGGGDERTGFNHRADRRRVPQICAAAPDRAQAALAVGLDDPQRQPCPGEPGRAEGGRPPGLLRLLRFHHDGAVFRNPAPAGPGSGETACRAGVPRHQRPVRPAGAREDGGAAAVRRRTILSEPHQGRAGSRFLHRVGGARRGDDQFFVANFRLCAAARLGPRAAAAGPAHRHRGRRRTGRGQYLRGAAGRLEARHPQRLVDHRLQPPEPGFGGARPAVRPHRGPVPRHGLERGDDEIRPSPAGRLRPRGRRGIAPLDRRLPQQPVLGPDLPGRGGVAAGGAGRSWPGARRARHHRPAVGRRAGCADDQSRRPRHRVPDRDPARRRCRRRPADLLHRLHHQGHGPALRRAQRQPCRADDQGADARVPHVHGHPARP